MIPLEYYGAELNAFVFQRDDSIVISFVCLFFFSSFFSLLKELSSSLSSALSLMFSHSLMSRRCTLAFPQSRWARDVRLDGWKFRVCVRRLLNYVTWHLGVPGALWRRDCRLRRRLLSRLVDPRRRRAPIRSQRCSSVPDNDILIDIYSKKANFRITTQE